MDTALATVEWRSFTQRHWGVEPVEFAFAPRGPNGPSLQAICYADRKGRLLLPPYQPHLPVRFTPTPTSAAYRIERQWIEISQLLVDEMLTRGTRGELTFSPELVDPRPWRWSSFRITARFTNFIDFPFAWDQADSVVRQRSSKAERSGYTCTRTTDMAAAMACLTGSQRRQGFAYGITQAGLELAQRLLGPDLFRVYLCRAPDGAPATARVILHRQAGRALDWLAGTVSSHLSSGATQLLLSHALQDLHRAGATGFNSCGADIPGVAQAKGRWGGRLVAQYSVQGYDVQPMKRLAGSFVRFLRARRDARRRRAEAALAPQGPEATPALRPAARGGAGRPDSPRDRASSA